MVSRIKRRLSQEEVKERVTANLGKSLIANRRYYIMCPGYCTGVLFGLNKTMWE